MGNPWRLIKIYPNFINETVYVRLLPVWRTAAANDVIDFISWNGEQRRAESLRPEQPIGTS